MPTYYWRQYNYPNAKPFDNPEYRWPSFVGEFIRPLIEEHQDLLYSCSEYFDGEKTWIEFCTYTDNQEISNSFFSNLEDHGFVKMSTTTRTLTENFASTRFIGPTKTSDEEKTRRALLILKSLTAVCNILADSVIKRDDGYWEHEPNGDSNNNPVHNHFFSINHLYHHITQTPACIRIIQHKDGKVGPISHYEYCHLLRCGQLSQDHYILGPYSVIM